MNYTKFDFWEEAFKDGITFEISIKINDDNKWLQLIESLENHNDILNFKFYNSKNEEIDKADISFYNYCSFSIANTKFNGLIEDKCTLVINFNPPFQQSTFIKIVELFQQIGQIVKVQIEISYEGSVLKDRLTN